MTIETSSNSIDVKAMFPGEEATQRLASLVVQEITELDLPIEFTKENIGALVQAFARGDAFNNEELFRRQLRFHFTYETDPQAAKVAGLANPNAVEEINSKQGNTFTNFSLIEDAATGADDVNVSGQVIETDAQGNETPRATGIMAGGQVVRVQRADREDIWMQVYQTGPGQAVYFQFDPFKEDGQTIPAAVLAAYGDVPSIAVRDEGWFDAVEGNTMFLAGEAGEVMGVAGNFTQFWADAQRSALQAAGVNDPGLMGKLLSDPEIARIVTVAAVAGQEISAPGIQAQIRNTTAYREVYPGIEYFLSRGDAIPEQSWRNYQQRVEPLMRQIGIAPDSDGTYRSSIAQYLDAGIDADELQQFVPVIKTIQANPNLKATMDQWAQMELGRPLDFNEFIDVLEGTSDPELAKVVEAATLADAASRAGVNVSVSDLRRIAKATDLTAEAALQTFTEAERAVLAVGNADLSKFGISRSDFIDAAAGITPRSGTSIAQVQNLARKIATERGISDDPDARFFQQLNRRGQLQASGLQSGQQIGG